MPKTNFYKTAIAPSPRDAPKPRHRIRMSKDMCAILKASRQQSSEKYQRALHETHNMVEHQIKDIANTYNRSAHRVRSDLHMGPQVSIGRHSRKSAWNAYCWKMAQQEKNPDKKGKEVLQDLVRNAKQKYATLTNEDKENLVSELEVVKATKAKGFRSSAKHRINDVTNTSKVLENEINNLRSRTGVEAILLITRSSTDMSLAGISFATPRVEEFFGTALKIDTHELLVRMEGFAIQGLKGTANSYKKRVTKLRADIRDEILKQLRTITGDENARMEWKHYHVKVVARYKVKIEGWPYDRIPFQNLSTASSPLAVLDSLLEMWQDGTIYWKTITSDDVDRLIEDLKAKGEIQEPLPRRPRSDRGKKRKRRSLSLDITGDEEESADYEPPALNKGRKRRKALVSRAILNNDNMDTGEAEDN